MHAHFRSTPRLIDSTTAAVMWPTCRGKFLRTFFFEWNSITATAPPGRSTPVSTIGDLWHVVIGITVVTPWRLAAWYCSQHPRELTGSIRDHGFVGC